MKSLRAQLTVWYAAAAITPVALLLVSGFFLLEGYFSHSLHMMCVAEFEEMKQRLDRIPGDLATVDGPELTRWLRRHTEIDARLFYIQIYRPGEGTLFASSKLEGFNLPDQPGSHFKWTAGALGELQISEFLHGSLHVQIATPTAIVGQLMRWYWQASLTLGGLFLGMSIVIGIALSRMALRPIRLIEQTARRIHVDNLSERIPVLAAQNEISALGQLLNRMFDRLESSVVEIRRFTAEVSHELKTPLVLARLNAERLLMSGGLSPEQKEPLHELLEEIGRLNQIVENLLFLAKADSGGYQLGLISRDPQGFIADFAEYARLLAEHHGLKFALSANDSGGVAIDASRLRQVLLNLVSNAINVSPPGGRLILASTIASTAWQLTLEDEGPGVSEKDLPRLFERFTRIGPDRPAMERKGNGLGLAISRSIIMLHGGTIRATNRLDRSGLKLRIEIPAKTFESQI